MKRWIAVIAMCLVAWPSPLRAGWQIRPQLTGPLGTARARHTAVALLDGRVLAVGGFEVRILPLPGVHVHKTAELFDPAAGTWSASTATMSSPRWDHEAVTLLDGRVLLAGGKTNFRKNTGTYTRSTELYDPVSDRFTPGPDMNAARAEFTATRLDDGRVVLAGGRDAQVFDPRTNSFTATIQLRVARSAHSAVSLGGSRVLLVGGESTAAGRSAEVIDVAKGVSRQLSVRMNPPINDLSLARLPNGNVLVAAGQRSDDGRTVDTAQVIQFAGRGEASYLHPVAARMDAKSGASDMVCFAFGPLVLLAGGEADLGDTDAIIERAWLFDAASEQFVASAKMQRPHDDFAGAPLAPDLFGRPRVLLTGGLTPDPEFSERPQIECEILTLCPDAALPPPATIAASGMAIVN